MAIPHIIQMQIIKKRLIGKEGKAKLNEIKEIQKGLPGFNTGPYGKIKKWLLEEIGKTKTRSKIKHQDWLGVKKEGIKQFTLVGLPSVGKSSLIKKLSGLQTKIAAYEFTTLKPIPGTINVNGADFQIVDLPGLLSGATEDVGGGKRLIGIVKSCDGVILMHDLSKPIKELLKIINELKKAKINKPMIIIGNKVDIDGSRERLKELKQEHKNNIVIGLSTITSEGIDKLKAELWNISKLIRIHPKRDKDNKATILKRDSTVEDFVKSIHKDLIEKFKFARVTGTSAKFPNQQLGLKHVLHDEDIVELVLEK